MVSYTRFVSLAFEVAPPGASATAIMSRAGALWNQNKAAIKEANVGETRDYLAKNL